MTTTLPRVELADPGHSSGPLTRVRTLRRELVATVWTIAGLAVVLGFVTELNRTRGFLLALAIACVVPLLSAFVEGRRKANDRLVSLLVSSAFVLALIPLLSILATVLTKGQAALSVEFFTSSMRNVVGEGGGVQHAIAGTLVITAWATLISVPIGLFSAIYLVEYGSGSPTARGLRFLVDVMTGVPSIVAGLFAYALFVVFFGEGVRMGIGGSVALSILMVPVVVRSSEEMLKLVPQELREAAWALGTPRWRTIVKVVLPTALSGIVTGVTLAIARVIGETAPLLVIAGMTDSLNLNAVDGRMATLPVFTYSSMMNPGFPAEPSIERAWGAALALLLVVMLLNLFARTVSAIFSPSRKR